MDDGSRKPMPEIPTVQWRPLLAAVADPSTGRLDFEGFAATVRQQTSVSEFSDSDVRQLWDNAICSNRVADPAGRDGSADLVADYLEARTVERTPAPQLDRSASTQQWLAASPLGTSLVEPSIPVERPTPDSRRHASAAPEPESRYYDPHDDETLEQRLKVFTQDLQRKHDAELARERARADAAEALASADVLEKQLTKFQADLTAKHRQEIEGLIEETTRLRSQLRLSESQVEPLKQAERLATERWRMREKDIANLIDEQRESEQIEEASAQKITELAHELRSARGEVILHKARADEYKEQLESEQRRVFGDFEMRKATQELKKKAQLLKRCHRMVLRTQAFAAWRDAIWRSKTVQWKYRAVQYGVRAHNALKSRASEVAISSLAYPQSTPSRGDTSARDHAQLTRAKERLAVGVEHAQLQRDNADPVAGREEQARPLHATLGAPDSETQRQTATELAAASGAQPASAEAKRHIESEGQRARAAAAASAEQLSTQEDELARLRDEVTQYAQALGTTQQREEEVQRELNALQGQLVNERNRAAQAHREIDGLHHALAVKEAEVVVANEARHKLEAAAATAQGSLDAARTDHAGAISERGQLEAALAAERENVGRERENADRAREKQRRLEEQLRSVEVGAETARREASEAKEQQAVAEKEASIHAASLVASRTELREARVAQEDAEDLAARLRDEVNTAKLEAKEQRSVAGRNAAALVERETELSVLQQEEEELRRLQQDEAQRLRSQSEALAASETTVKQLRTELQEVSARAAEQAQAESEKRTWEDQQESLRQEQSALAPEQTHTVKMEQLDNLATIGLRRVLANSKAIHFAIWRERTRGLAEMSRLHNEHKLTLAACAQREGNLRQDCADAQSAAKAAVLRLLNAADTLNQPSASKVIRLRSFDTSFVESTLVEEVVQLLSTASRSRFASVQHEPELHVDAASRPDTIDIEILPPSSTSPGPSSEKLLHELAEAIGLGTHQLFAEGVALPMIDREYGVGTVDHITGEVCFEHSAYSMLVRLQTRLTHEEEACENMRSRHREVSAELERRTADASAKQLEIESMQVTLSATHARTETQQKTLAAIRGVIDRARVHLRQRSMRTCDVICLRGAFSKWAVESRETFRCEGAWLRGQLVNLESDLENEMRIVEGLKDSLKLAKEAADASRTAHQAQLGRVKEREAKKGRRVEAALLRRCDLNRIVRRTFRAWVAARQLSVRQAEHLRSLRTAFRAWIFSLEHLKLIEQLYESTAAIEALQEAQIHASTVERAQKLA